MALGVIDAARERGVDVPGQLSVAGFDDTARRPRAPASPPSASRTPRRAPQALRLLLDDTKRSVLLPTELVPRSTTAPSP